MTEQYNTKELKFWQHEKDGIRSSTEGLKMPVYPPGSRKVLTGEETPAGQALTFEELKSINELFNR